MVDVLEGRATIQPNSLGHGLTSLAYFSKGKRTWDRMTPCNRTGWARQQHCRKDLEVLVDKPNVDQPRFFCGSMKFYVGSRFPS